MPAPREVTGWTIPSSGNTFEISPMARRCKVRASVRVICLASHDATDVVGCMISSSRNTLEPSPMCRRCKDDASIRESCLASHNATGTSLFDISPHPMEDFALIPAHEDLSLTWPSLQVLPRSIRNNSARWRHTTATRIHGLVLHLRIDCAL